MIISRDIRSWVCSADAPILDALAQISAHRRGAVFCVEHDGRLVGVLTDGDFRRWVVEQPDLDVHQPVRAIANASPRTAPVGSPPADLDAQLNEHIRFIPLVDERGHLVAVASARGGELRLGDRSIGEDEPAFVIAEIGNNHNGSIDVALELIDEAADAGADSAKFQLRHMASLYREGGRDGEDLGTQYTMDLLDRFQLTPDELYRAFDRCTERGLVPLCTPWDVESLEALEAYGLPGYKVASADLTNHDLLAAMADTAKPLILSTGMSSEAEIREAVTVLQRHGASYALLQCNSTYPAPYKDLNLRYLEQLGRIGACPVGYSGHERGWHIPVAAVALGARIIEKHLTIDRAMEGNDHKVSLLPSELARMITEIRQLEESLGTGGARTVTQGESMNRVTLAKSLIATRTLEVGDVVASTDVSVKAPGRGLQPNRRQELIGRAVTRRVAAGDFFYPSDVDAGYVEARAYDFRRPWGLPVRYHDLESIIAKSAPDFVEFHLSYQDMELDPADYISHPLSCGFAVHSPELFRGDFLLNFADLDDLGWRRSIEELQRVIDVTRRLKPLFPATENPVIIVNFGGFTSDEPLAPTERPALYERILEGLSHLDREGVDVTAQTMPPFPWLFGGQLHHNLFLDPEDGAAFAEQAGIGLTLDVSHSKLACNHLGTSFSEFVERVGPLVHHLHLVDASGSDAEGLQIGDGEIDWPVLAEQLDRLAPGVGFIPEIWQGHKNDGEGFWIALDRLERWL